MKFIYKLLTVNITGSKKFCSLSTSSNFSKLSITKVLNLNYYKILSYDRYDERTDYLILKQNLKPKNRINI